MVFILIIRFLRECFLYLYLGFADASSWIKLIAFHFSAHLRNRKCCTTVTIFGQISHQLLVLKHRSNPVALQLPVLTHFLSSQAVSGNINVGLVSSPNFTTFNMRALRVCAEICMCPFLFKTIKPVFRT